MCPREHLKQTGDISLDLVRSLQPAFERAALVFLHGIGEPLLHREFKEIVACVSKTNVARAFNTNGTLLTRDRVECLIEHNVTYVTVSIDAATEPLYSSIRRGAHLEGVLEGMRCLNDEKAKANSRWPKLAFEFVLMQQNMSELPALVLLAREHGVGVIRVIDLILHSHEDSGIEEDWAEQTVRVDSELVRNTLARARRLATDAGITLVLPERFSNGRRGSRNGHARVPFCHEPWETVYVNFDGKVFPCCASTECMGDLKKTCLDVIWNGDAYQRLRANLKSGRVPRDCAECTSRRTRSATYRTLMMKRLAAWGPFKGGLSWKA
jgi:radical SAM protein with 4Fe4S-binding SPASM domain